MVMSGEDLTNIGPVALQQDLAVMATLGIESVERNGHHYFAGLSQFPESVQRQVLEHHSDLYRRSLQGWPTVAIEQGRGDGGEGRPGRGEGGEGRRLARRNRAYRSRVGQVYRHRAGRGRAAALSLPVAG
uniref:Uncharacterized protein n=1 Tax=uncultured Armatimonadetes bacterium TaxID=157466 RepID=A0A6J4HGF7_9BACT|nr:hypothetical protein AVDCRST_MAG63-500 [uncultured Armatimonadetes bacterium]